MTASDDRTGSLAPAPVTGAEELEREVRRLRELLAVAEAAIQSLRDRCEDAEEARANLAQLAVASARLHETDEQAESLRNLQDLLLNLVGAEQIAIWSLSADGRTLDLRASQGIDAEPWRSVAVGEGALGKAVATGDIVVQVQTGAGQPTVCIPLTLGQRVVGAVAVFRLLPHRSGLGPQDENVFRLVSQQAAFALGRSGEPWGATRKVGDG